MDFFTDAQTMDFFAELDAAGTMDAFSFREDHNVPEASDQATLITPESREAATPVGTPMSEAPPPLQLPTPPQPLYSVSASFHSKFHCKNLGPDAIFITTDRVIFYAHTSVLLIASQNAFNGLLSVEAIERGREITAGPLLIVTVPANSTLFNVVFHTIYGISCTQYSPSLDILLEAVTELRTYGVSQDKFISPDKPIFHHILSETPRNPINVFLVASENDLEPLAVATSVHLHSLHLPSITDEMVNRMGPKYFKRLVNLHIERTEYLKQILLDPPTPHVDTVDCGFIQRRSLARAWAFATASLVWDIRPDLPAGVLRSTLGSLEQKLGCSECKANLAARVRQIVLDWTTRAKSTI
ncbi:hypothetical protein EIP91_003413 [Steccherinum ochraceum]|uniref:Uncharacterized protein n=1 Tax=Steccherinum ochraceum TaxID=92696 RepID=A0A4R0RGW6_9APHY|nr:hypothetical protein EIP91_003413 [Steccherinum ochraceum]